MDEYHIKLKKCPLRITIAPSGGDNPLWCDHYDGHSYTATLDKFVYVLACESPVQEFKLCYSEMESLSNADDIKHSILKNIFADPYFEKQYWSIITWSDLPARAGLGSSAAFTIASLRSLNYQCNNIALRAFEFIDDENIGPQDEYAVVNLGVNKFTFRRLDGHWQVDKESYKPNNWHFYLLDSGKRRLSGELLRRVMHRSKFYSHYRWSVELLGDAAFNAYIHEDYEEYRKILLEYNELKYSIGALSACDYATLTELSDKYACKSVGAGNGGFYLIASEDGITEEGIKHGNLIPINITNRL